MALVPRCSSRHDAPGAKATRSALFKKYGSPMVCIKVPRLSASITTLCIWRTCSNRYSMTGREWASSSWLRAMVWRKSPPEACSVAISRPMGDKPAAMLRCHDLSKLSFTAPGSSAPYSMRCWRAWRNADAGVGCCTWSPARVGVTQGPARIFLVSVWSAAQQCATSTPPVSNRL